jgi:hypothetical protein
VSFSSLVRALSDVNERTYRLDYIINTLIPSQMMELDDERERNTSTLNLKIPLSLDTVIVV